jgi:hypothetical protein
MAAALTLSPAAAEIAWRLADYRASAKRLREERMALRTGGNEQRRRKVERTLAMGRDALVFLARPGTLRDIAAHLGVTLAVARGVVFRLGADGSLDSFPFGGVRHFITAGCALPIEFERDDSLEPVRRVGVGSETRSQRPAPETWTVSAKKASPPRPDDRDIREEVVSLLLSPQTAGDLREATGAEPGVLLDVLTRLEADGLVHRRILGPTVMWAARSTAIGVPDPCRASCGSIRDVEVRLQEFGEPLSVREFCLKIGVSKQRAHHFIQKFVGTGHLRVLAGTPLRYLLSDRPVPEGSSTRMLPAAGTKTGASGCRYAPYLSAELVDGGLKHPHARSERLVADLLSDSITRTTVQIAKATRLSSVTVKNTLVYLAHYGRAEPVPATLPATRDGDTQAA